MLSVEDLREQYKEDYPDKKKDIHTIPPFTTKVTGYELFVEPYCSKCPKFVADSATKGSEEYTTVIFCCHRDKCIRIDAILRNIDEIQRDPILRDFILKRLIREII